MTDEQLLRDAAKAVGYTVVALDRSDLTGGEWVATIEVDGRNYNWAPHISDADAFRLAVDLEMILYLGPHIIGVSVFNGPVRHHGDVMFEDHPDKYAATRYAIARAAAAIGSEADRQQ